MNDADIWLNLRNPLSTQFRPHLPGKPHRLRLEVKFFVAPQELQQEETRCVITSSSVSFVYYQLSHFMLTAADRNTEFTLHFAHKLRSQLNTFL